MWPSIIAAGGDVLGGVLGGVFGKKNKGPSIGKQKRHALDYDRRRIKAITDGAKDAGIHPLVALGATGGGFSPTISVPGQSSWGDVIGDAVSRFAGAGAEYMQQDADQEAWDDRQFEKILRENTPEPPSEMDRLNQRIAEATLLEVQSRTALNRARMGALGATVGGEMSVPRPFGIPVVPTGTAAAEDVENRYGEIAGEVAGVGNILGDSMNTVRPYVPDWMVPPVWRLLKRGYDVLTR